MRRVAAQWRLGVAVAGLGALIVGVDPLALVALVTLISGAMPGPSRVRQIAYAILVLFGANAFVLTLLSFLGFRWHAHLMLAGYLILSGGAAAVSRASPTKPLLGQDAWALAAAIAAFGVFFRPYAGATLGKKMALLSYSTDAANHLNYTQIDLLRAAYDPNIPYPQAWAGNVGLTVDLLVGQHPSARAFITIAVPIIIGLYALLVFFAVSLVSTSFDLRPSGRTPSLAALGATSCFGLSVIWGPSNLLLESSSYTEIVAITVLLAVGLLLASAGLSGSPLSLAIVGILGLSLMQTWYLLAPVLALLLIGYLRATRPDVGRAFVILTPFMLASLYPIVHGPSAISHLNAQGGLDYAGPATIAALLLLMLVSLLRVLCLQSLRRQAFALVTLVAGTLAFTVLVVLVQNATGGGRSYYSVKVLFAALLFAAALASTVVGMDVSRLLNRQGSTRRQVLTSAASVIVILGGYAFTVVDSRELSGRYASGATPPFLDGRVLDAIFSAHPHSVPSGTEIWVADGCARGLDRLANKWSHDLYPDDNIDKGWEDTNIRYRFGKRGDVGMLVKRAANPKIKHFDLYVHHECDPHVVKVLSLLPKVRVFNVP